jgi:hypothetical protein
MSLLKGDIKLHVITELQKIPKGASSASNNTKIDI